MDIVITGDTASEAGVSQIIYDWCGPTRKHFAPGHYGEGLLGFCVVLMCQNPELNLKRRVRFARKTKELYLDIMLDLPEMIAADPETRRRIVKDRLAEEVPAILRKYAIRDFEETRFLEDWQSWLKTLPE